MTSNDVPRRDGDLIAVGPDPIDPAAVLGAVTATDCGAVVLFLGTVRDHSVGKEGVTHLEYEAYEGIVEPKLSGGKPPPAGAQARVGGKPRSDSRAQHRLGSTSERHR